jgi:hypothetical protein
VRRSRCPDALLRRARQALALAALLLGALAPAGAAGAAAKLEVNIVYVTRAQPANALPPLSLVEPRKLPDEGLAGATLAIKDNQTTGKFLGQTYTLDQVTVPADGDLTAAVQPKLAGGDRLIVADLEEPDLLALADLPAAKDALIFNGRAEDDDLRTDVCRGNVFHTIPSRAMKADALVQYLMWAQKNTDAAAKLAAGSGAWRKHQAPGNKPLGSGSSACYAHRFA